VSTPVLYDDPGPRTRRRVLLGSIVAGAVLLVVAGIVLHRLYQQDQLSEERWGPLVNPFDPQFAAVWSGLLEALLLNITAAALAMVLSLATGTLLALTRITSAAWYRWAVVGVIEVLRGLPVVIAIFLSYRILPELGVELPRIWYLVIGLTAYNAVVIAEIVRAGVASLPRGQAEAASAIGLTRGQSLRLVQLPQAFRIMLPALISQLVVVFKDTSLGFIILFPEVISFARIAIQTLGNPLQLYFVIAILFIAINYLLGRFAQWVERRLSRAVPAGGTKPAVFTDESAALASTDRNGR